MPLSHCSWLIFSAQHFYLLYCCIRFVFIFCVLLLFYFFSFYFVVIVFISFIHRFRICVWSKHICICTMYPNHLSAFYTHTIFWPKKFLVCTLYVCVYIYIYIYKIHLRCAFRFVRFQRCIPMLKLMYHMDRQPTTDVYLIFCSCVWVPSTISVLLLVGMVAGCLRVSENWR